MMSRLEEKFLNKMSRNDFNYHFWYGDENKKCPIKCEVLCPVADKGNKKKALRLSADASGQFIHFMHLKSSNHRFETPQLH